MRSFSVGSEGILSTRRNENLHVVAPSPRGRSCHQYKALMKHDFIVYLASGCKPREKWRIEKEHEKFGFKLDTLRPAEYSKIVAILERLAGPLE